MTGVAAFVKYPEPGKVKTRLARDVGEARAAALYRGMIGEVGETLCALSTLEYAVHWFCDPFRDRADYEALNLPGRFHAEMQRGEDLGARLLHAFEALLEPYPRAIIIGTDCVELTPELVDQAGQMLKANHDVVLGPAMDGGYYLIGLRQAWPVLFRGIPWSTEYVCERTQTRARELSLRMGLLPTLRDIDSVKDLGAKTYP